MRRLKIGEGPMKILL